MILKLKKKSRGININKAIRKAIAGSKMVGKKEEKKETQIISGPITIQNLQQIEKALDERRHTKEIKEEPKEEGVSLEEKPGFVPRKKEPEVDLRTVNISYSLIPKNSRNPFAMVNVKWSKADNSLVYYVIQPKLSKEEAELLNKIKASLIEKLDVDFTRLRKGEAKDYLKGKFEEMVNLLATTLPPEKRKQILYYIERDFIGLDKIEPLMEDPDIEDVSCDGIGLPIYIYHRNPVIGSIKTNIFFETAKELNIFVNKLAQRCGKTVSVAHPIVNASLPDGSRVQLTLGTDIARRGSNFTIRKFTENPLTPVDIIDYKTMDPKLASYLWMMIEYGRTMLITGGVATGKTSMLNALSLFIKPDLKIVSIEDTPELRLPHPHWVPQVARQPIAQVGGRGVGEVDLFDLLRESLRQRPDYLIVGEVRGREAYVLFQQIATGHASLSTIHADSMERLMDRLTTPPISLPPNLIEALDIIIFLVRIKYGNMYVRKVSSVLEILGYDKEKGVPKVNEVFRWNPSTDKFENVNKSVILGKIVKQYGLSEKYLQREVNQREKILDWMHSRGIRDYRDVSRIINIYYTRPEELLSAI